MGMEYGTVSEEEDLRGVSGDHDRVGPPAVETWVRVWWPWLVLVLGAAAIAVGGFLFSHGVNADRPAQFVIVSTATS
jgi:hypothetical protein